MYAIRRYYEALPDSEEENRFKFEVFEEIRVMRKFLLLLLLVSLAWSTQVLAGSVVAPETCLECHEDVVSEEDFAASVHGPNGCVACHIELVAIDLHIV